MQGGVCIRHGGHRCNDATEKVAERVRTKHGAKVNDAAVKDAQIMLGMDTKHVLKNNTQGESRQHKLCSEWRSVHASRKIQTMLSLRCSVKLMRKGRGRFVDNNRNNIRRVVVTSWKPQLSP